ncbi:protein-glutamine gamma-glutamyltransferase [Clostridium sp.]|uniref:protein-glutamine gamma-glutamyltransferase n=1 Tax=Clostridium sp. TaxID=1506 RepID=UPI0039F61C7D
MLIISNKIMSTDDINKEYNLKPLEEKIVNTMTSSNQMYRFDSLKELKFELDLRLSIVKASRDLYKSNFRFRVFKEAKCNPKYWTLTSEGGFLLKRGVEPYTAIEDIYLNSSMYGTECSTAIIIVYYKALLDILPRNLFNKLFDHIYLMNWKNLDDDLGIATYSNVIDYFPGDCRYFKNPDVNPKTPEWQGENAIDLGNGTYYGHGIGIKTADEIIKELNKNRKEGSTKSAYLMDTATRLDFKYLAKQYIKFESRLIMLRHYPFAANFLSIN